MFHQGIIKEYSLKRYNILVCKENFLTLSDFISGIFVAYR
ncbi:hypothetical protein CZ787_03750 [Halomonas citrativorans]|uniref:Uncharacterized protein n=1 Tax=Halomonas citrativorans TaxID=2742612 RepID=A0A1R4HTG6_9GAMM|nr:hypothetical protein CZ787_03750 [Halomonas citrativorans]